MYSLEHVSLYYPGDIVALDDVSVHIPKGSWFSIIGKSGSGKSTFLSILRGDLAPTNGTVLLEGVDLYSLRGDSASAYRREIGSVYQDSHFIGHLTVAENVALIMEHAEKTVAEIETDVPYVLDLMGIAQHKDRYPHELSGGERQRLQLARAFVHQPDILLIDEPISHLDSSNADRVLALLKKLHEMGTTLVVSSHSKELFKDYQTHTIILDGGKVIHK